jgi:hypothetical protein
MAGFQNQLRVNLISLLKLLGCSWISVTSFYCALPFHKSLHDILISG